MDTQSPTAREETDTAASLLKVVDGVQLTVTCPDCWFWTSIDEPEMAATEPDAPGAPRPLVLPPDAPPAAPEAAGVVELLVAAEVLDEPPPPQAVTKTTKRPQAPETTAQRRVR
jgi:hypothetical protein